MERGEGMTFSEADMETLQPEAAAAAATDAHGVADPGSVWGGMSVQWERLPYGGSSPLPQMLRHPAASLSLLSHNRREEGGGGREGD